MQDPPFWKAVLVTIGIVAIALGLIYAASLIGFDDMWVAFLALVMWGAGGSKIEQAPGVFLGGAYGLILAWSVEGLPDRYGDWAVIIPVVAVVLTISCLITGKLPVFCNYSTFAFLTVGGAGIVLDQGLHFEYLSNLAFGAVLFWLVPWLVLRLRGRATSDESGTVT